MKYYSLESHALRRPNGQYCWMIDIPLTLHALSGADGKRVATWNPKLIAVYPEGPVDFDFGHAGTMRYPIFSSRLRAFFERNCPRMIQFLPIRLERDDGTLPMDGYSLGKFLHVVECIDRKRTRVDNNDWTPSETGEYQICGPVCLRQSGIGDAVCFHVKGASDDVICRDDLRLAIEREKFKGFKFETVKISEKA